MESEAHQQIQIYLQPLIIKLEMLEKKNMELQHKMAQLSSMVWGPNGFEKNSATPLTKNLSSSGGSYKKDTKNSPKNSKISQGQSEAEKNSNSKGGLIKSQKEESQTNKLKVQSNAEQDKKLTETNSAMMKSQKLPTMPPKQERQRITSKVTEPKPKQLKKVQSKKNVIESSSTRKLSTTEKKLAPGKKNQKVQESLKKVNQVTEKMEEEQKKQNIIQKNQNLQINNEGINMDTSMLVGKEDAKIEENNKKEIQQQMVNKEQSTKVMEQTIKSKSQINTQNMGKSTVPKKIQTRPLVAENKNSKKAIDNKQQKIQSKKSMKVPSKQEIKQIPKGKNSESLKENNKLAMNTSLENQHMRKNSTSNKDMMMPMKEQSLEEPKMEQKINMMEECDEADLLCNQVLQIKKDNLT